MKHAEVKAESESETENETDYESHELEVLSDTTIDEDDEIERQKLLMRKKKRNIIYLFKTIHNIKLIM